MRALRDSLPFTKAATDGFNRNLPNLTPEQKRAALKYYRLGEGKLTEPKPRAYLLEDLVWFYSAINTNLAYVQGKSKEVDITNIERIGKNIEKAIGPQEPRFQERGKELDELSLKAMEDEIQKNREETQKNREETQKNREIIRQLQIIIKALESG